MLWDVSQWIDQYYYVLLACFTIAGLFWFRHKKVFIIALLLTALIAPTAKQVFAEDRPCVGLGTCPVSEGFPSVHAASAMVFAFAAIGSTAFPFFMIVALVIGGSRVAFGVHTVPQVIAGFALGALIYCVVWSMAYKLKDEEVAVRHGLMD
ncbi:PAP2 superfamily protein [Candidatus Norongarragalina meridionalis]|nr:PAP2 superfamily protein [Candidatus Norongarragalina meridionalis]